MQIKHSDPQILDDNPFANCQLDREKYADVLTNIVDSFPEGFVLAINNNWGTGKTVFIRMWQQKLKLKKFNTIYFNAWVNDFDVDPLAAILGELRLLLPSTKKKTFNSVVSKATIFGKKALPALTKQLGKKYLGEELAEELSAASEGTMDIIEKEIDEYTAKQKGVVDFKNELAKFIKETNSEKPLVFFVDELDRCRPDYAVSFLEKVKHFFVVPGIVFVLAIDKKQLSNCIRGRYGTDRLDADDYLRKLIDLEYSIPLPSSLSYCSYMYDFYSFKDFFENKERRQFVEFKDDPSLFIKFSGLLFGQKDLTLREQDKIFALSRLVLKCFEKNQYLFPALYIFLIYLSIYKKDLYGKIRSVSLTLNEFVEEIELNLPKDSPDDPFNGLMGIEAQLLHFYYNGYREKNHQINLLAHKESGQNQVLVKTKYTNTDSDLRFYNLLSEFRRHNWSDIKLSYLMNKIDLTESFIL